MADWTPAQLNREIRAARQNGLLGLLIGAAQRHGLPPAYLVAIATRETNLTNIVGDGGHGISVLQIDTRSHEIARRMKADGTWRTKPGVLIEYGAALLAKEREWAKANWPEFDSLKIAAAAYNSGEQAARRGVEAGDVDAHTTNGYAADVLARMKAIEEIGL